MQYWYDAAHRLAEITDGLNDTIVYTFDLMGNRTHEDFYFPSTPWTARAGVRSTGSTACPRNWGRNRRPRPTPTTTTVTCARSCPLHPAPVNTYDALNRLVQVLDPGSTTRYAYDPANNLTRVTDARTLATRYGTTG